MNLKPWEVDPELKEECLVTIGRIIKRVRNETVALYEPESGDSPWGLGCRIYDRLVNVFEKESINYDWFQLIRDNLYFVILVNGVPIRYYKGSPEAPPLRTLRKHLPEIRAEQLFFGFEEASREWSWRIGVETDEEHKLFRTTIAQLDCDGNYRNIWVIPTIETVSPITSVQTIQRESVVLKSQAEAIRPKAKISKELKNATSK